LNTSESISEIPGKFGNVVLAKDGDHLADGVRSVLHSVNEERNILQTIKKES
jgi:hypothetical protein